LNKEEPIKSDKYNIRINNYQTLYIKPYYALIINDLNGKFEIYIPCYDIDEIVRLTELKIVDEEKLNI